jgi:hypothetical protein
LADYEVVNVAGWLADGDDLIIPLTFGSETTVAIIELAYNGAFVATIPESADLYRKLAEIRKLDIEFLQDRYRWVTWQDAADCAPAEIRVHGRDTHRFLRNLLDLVAFAQAVLDYGAGCDVRSRLADELTLRNTTVRNLTEANAVLVEANGRLQAAMRTAIEERKAS